MTNPERFGCAQCWPGSPDAAWTARKALRSEGDLVDESHYHVMVLACASCSQHFLSVFTETVDWVDGEDPQHWATLPLTLEERVGLGKTPTEAQIDALGPGRRCLRRDYPKRAEPRCFWDEGMRVRPHD